MRGELTVSPAKAHQAVAELVRDSASVNRAVQSLILHAQANGLGAATILGWLSHKFFVIEDGLAHLVMGADDPDDTPVTDPISQFDFDPRSN